MSALYYADVSKIGVSMTYLVIDKEYIGYYASVSSISSSQSS